MAQDLINNDLYVNGSFAAKTMTLPAGVVNNSQVQAAAGINSTKLQHRHCIDHYQQTGVAVVTANQLMHIVKGVNSAMYSIRAIVDTIATGADRTVTIDLQKSTGAGAFATILAATIVFNNVSTARTVSNGAFSSTTLVAGDILKLTVTVAGAAGAQALGLLVTVELDEDGN